MNDDILLFRYPGHYAILKARDDIKDVDKIGELVSQVMRTSEGPKCIVFWYLMNGKSVNYLDISLRINNKHFKVWQRKGHQGNYWHRGAFSLPKTEVEYYVGISLY